MEGKSKDGIYSKSKFLSNELNWKRKPVEDKSLSPSKEPCCVKHPNQPNNLFCYDDLKTICEQCIPMHKGHKVESIPLIIAKIKSDMEESGSIMEEVGNKWKDIDVQIKVLDSLVELEIKNAEKSIDSFFNMLIDKLKERKNEVIELCKIKCHEFYKDTLSLANKASEFNDKYKILNESIALIEKSISNNSQISTIKEYNDKLSQISPQQIDLLKKEFIQISSTAADIQKSGFEKLQFQSKFDLDKLLDFLNNQYEFKSIKIARDGEAEKMLLKKEIQESVQTIDTFTKSIIAYNKGSWSRRPYKLKLKKHADLKYTDIKEFKALINGNQGIIVDYSKEKQYQNRLYTLKDDVIEQVTALPSEMSKISICNCGDKIFISGEGKIILYELVKDTIIECTGFFKQISYVMCTVENRYIYAFPTQLNKLYKLDLHEGPTNNKLVFESLTVKNSKNFCAKLDSKSIAMVLNETEIMVVTSKGSLIYNIEANEITDYYTLKVTDEFSTNALVKYDSVYILGKKGLHYFSVISKKWDFIRDSSLITL